MEGETVREVLLDFTTGFWHCRQTRPVQRFGRAGCSSSKDADEEHIGELERTSVHFATPASWFDGFVKGIVTGFRHRPHASQNSWMVLESVGRMVGSMFTGMEVATRRAHR